jgi:hypothetical protein
MSFGNSPLDDAGSWSYKRHEKLVAQADAERAARLAGHKSPFRRLLDRLRPHRQEQGGDPQGNYGTTDGPPR